MLQIYNLNTDVLFHWINLKKEINRINLQIYYIILEIIRLEISNYVDSKKKSIQLYVQLFGSNKTF